MENLHAHIINYLLTQSWQIAVLAMAIAAISLVVRNKSAHVRYLLWLIVLGKCLVPSLLTISLAVLPERRVAEPVVTSPVEMPVVTVEAVDVVPVEPVTLPPVPAVRQPPAKPSIRERLAAVTLRQWLALVWLVGVVVFVLVAVTKALRVNRWLRRARKTLPAGLQMGIENLFGDLDVRTVPKVWLVEGIGQPFVWGLLRGSIYLPANFAGAESDKHRRGVLGHELSHILRFDAAVNLLQIIAQAVYWFHPFVWWANKKIRAEREKCCDEMAIARLGAKAKDYSSAIVNTLIAEHEATLPIPSLAVAGPVKNIEDRIKTIMNPGKRFYRRPSLIAAITVLVLALIAVPTTLALTARKAKAPEKMDVETILAKVRKAQRPAGNMRIEWVSEKDLAHSYYYRYRPKKKRPGRQPVIEKGSAVISGLCSRVEQTEEYYEGEITKQPVRVRNKTSVFDGTEQRILEEFTKGWGHGGKSGRVVSEDRNWSLLTQLLFGDNPLQHSKQHLEEYKFKLELLENDVPGIYVLKITAPKGHSYDLISVDGNRGYNIVKRELIRSSDGVKLQEDAFELKKYPNGIWFLSKREKRAYTSGFEVLARPRLEEKVTVTNAQFDMPEPDGKMFKLEFPAGTRVRILGSEIAIGEDGEEELRQVIESAKKLQGLGKAVAIFANDHEEGKLPDTLQQLHKGDYASKKDLAWLLENVEYLGKGITATDSPGTAIAYDKTLLRKGDGTNVLFLDGHVAFERPEQLEKLGIAGELAWGEAVDGVRCRLWATKRVWKLGERPTFSLDVWNYGDNPIRVDFSGSRPRYEIEYDGRWYGYTGKGIIRGSLYVMDLAPGEEISDAVGVDFPGVWVTPVPPNDGKPDLFISRIREEPQKLLDFSPGTHEVRVRLYPIRQTQDRGAGVVSNPVQIEILPWGGTAGKGEAVREKPSVWLTVLPKSPIRSLNEYEHWIRTDPRPTAPLYKPVPIPACDFEVRRASDQQRVARIPLGESFGGTGELTQSARRRFGWLGNGEYLVALCIGYWRCSNVSRLTLDSDFDGSVEPTLSLVSLEAAPGGKLPFLGIRAVGPTPQDPKLTNETIAFPKLVVDGVERNPTMIKWIGPVGPLESGRVYTRLLNLDGYEPAIEQGKEHTVKAIVGKYESASVVIPADNLLGQQWDIATKKLPPVPPPRIVLEGKVTGLEGKVAEGYQVSLSNLSGSVFKESTKQDGTYQFINVPPGKYSLVCHLKGKGMPDLEIENVQIHEGETLTVDMSLHRKYILSGTVSYEDGRPAANIGVWLTCEDRENHAEFNDYIATDANGGYELGGPFGTVSYIGIKGKRIEGSMPRLEPGRTELRFILRKNEAGRHHTDTDVYKQLDEIVDLSGWRPEVSFSEALEELKNSVEPLLKIVVLWGDLAENADIDQSTSINIGPLPPVRLSMALELLLKSVSGGKAELGYAIKDGVITITTVESLPSRLEARVYDIALLVGPPLPGGYGGYGATFYGKYRPSAEGIEKANERAKEIAKLIEETIEPDSWWGAGGVGTITVYQNRKLIVYQRREVHQKIAKLLSNMQRPGLSEAGIPFPKGLHPLPTVQIESRFILVPADANEIKEFLEELEDFEIVPLWAEPNVKHYLLEGEEGGQLLKKLREGEPNCSMTLAAPKVTVLSGESAALSIQTQTVIAAPPPIISKIIPRAGAKCHTFETTIPTGTTLSITPIISADKKDILLNLNVEITNFLGEITNFLGMKTCILETPLADGTVAKYERKLPQIETVSVLKHESQSLMGQRCCWPVRKSKVKGNKTSRLWRKSC